MIYNTCVQINYYEDDALNKRAISFGVILSSLVKKVRLFKYFSSER